MAVAVALCCPARLVALSLDVDDWEDCSSTECPLQAVVIFRAACDHRLHAEAAACRFHINETFDHMADHISEVLNSCP